MDGDRARNELADRLLPARIERLDLAPVARITGDQLGDALGEDVAGVELEVPAAGADIVPKPLRFLFGLEELAEQVHGVQVDEHPAEVEDWDQGIGHGSAPRSLC